MKETGVNSKFTEGSEEGDWSNETEEDGSENASRDKDQDGAGRCSCGCDAVDADSDHFEIPEDQHDSELEEFGESRKEGAFSKQERIDAICAFQSMPANKRSNDWANRLRREVRATVEMLADSQAENNEPVTINAKSLRKAGRGVPLEYVAHTMLRMGLLVWKKEGTGDWIARLVG